MRAAGRASPLGDGAAVKGVDGGAERLRKVPIPFKGPVQEKGSRFLDSRSPFKGVLNTITTGPFLVWLALKLILHWSQEQCLSYRQIDAYPPSRIALKQ